MKRRFCGRENDDSPGDFWDIIFSEKTKGCFEVTFIFWGEATSQPDVIHMIHISYGSFALEDRPEVPNEY